MFCIDEFISSCESMMIFDTFVDMPAELCVGTESYSIATEGVGEWFEKKRDALIAWIGRIIRKFKEWWSNFTTKKSKLRQEIKDKDEAYKDAMKQIDELKKSLQHKERESDGHLADAVKYKSQYDEERRKNDELKHERDSYRNTSRATADSLASLRKENDVLKDTVAGTRDMANKNIEELQKGLDAAKVRINKLENIYDNKMNELAQIIKQFDKIMDEYVDDYNHLKDVIRGESSLVVSERWLGNNIKKLEEVLTKYKKNEDNNYNYSNYSNAALINRVIHSYISDMEVFINFKGKKAVKASEYSKMIIGYLEWAENALRQFDGDLNNEKSIVSILTQFINNSNKILSLIQDLQSF